MGQKTKEEREELLAKHIQMAIVCGARVESKSEDTAVLVYGKRVNHILHFILGIFTGGLWWIVWLILAITGGEKRKMITTDKFGTISKYDGKGNCIERAQYNPDGSLDGKMIFKYDKKGSCIEFASYKPDGSLDDKFFFKHIQV